MTNNNILKRYIECTRTTKQLLTILRNAANSINHRTDIDTKTKSEYERVVDRYMEYIDIANAQILIVRQVGLRILHTRIVAFVTNRAGATSLSEFLKLVGVECEDLVKSMEGIFIPTGLKIGVDDSATTTMYDIHPQRLCLKNNITNSLYGALIELIVGKTKYSISGTISADRLGLERAKISTRGIRKEIESRYPNSKLLSMIQTLSLRDRLAYDVTKQTTFLKRNVDRIAVFHEMSYQALRTDYNFLPYPEKIQNLHLLYYGGLFEVLKRLFYEESDQMIRKYLDIKVSAALPHRRTVVLRVDGRGVGTNSPENLEDQTKDNLPYEMKIAAMNTTNKIKTKAIDMLKQIRNSSDGAPKAQKYLDGLLRIPFGVLRSEPGMVDGTKDLIATFEKENPNLSIDRADDPKVVRLKAEIKKEKTKNMEYLKQVMDVLDRSVHGHEVAKNQLQRLVAQWICGGQKGVVLGIQGPPGNGKTTLIKRGLASCLTNQEGEARPVGFIPLGGSTKGNLLEGHSYTYQGSVWGRIVETLMDAKCMNPILLFDELDKVQSPEITGILTHLTDPTQNTEFNDRYFDGVALDMSKSLIVFTFNDISKIDPILLDRITLIETKPLRMPDKIQVARKHLLPEITQDVGLRIEDVEVTDTMIESIVNNYTAEAGARQLKQLLQDLIRELNLRRLCSGAEGEVVIDEALVDRVFRHKYKPRHQTIPNEPIMGQINGMYANVLGMGGVLPIQVRKSESTKLLELELTGTQGDVMKESMRCAKTIAWSLLSDEMKKTHEDNPFGLHIHCPSTSTPKDGPSAGGAIALSILSIMTNVAPNHKISMTGEIDLQGNITAIGGLGPKLVGAKRAGVEIAIIPYENQPQLQLLREDGLSPEDDDFKVVMVRTVLEAKAVFGL